MKYLVGMGLGVAIVVGCKSPQATADGALVESDVAIDMASDVVPDVPPDARSPSPACQTAPTTLIDVAPLSINSIARNGNTLYVSVWDASSATQFALLTIDLTTGTQSMPSFATQSLLSLATSAGEVMGVEYSVPDATIWRLRSGLAPEALVEHRPNPSGGTSDGTYVYWTEVPGIQMPSEIKRRLVVGGPVEPIVTGSTPWHVVGTELYFWRGFGLGRVHADGSGAVVDITIPTSDPVFAIEAVDSSIYFAPYGGNAAIYSVDNASSNATVFSSATGTRIVGLAASTDYLYTIDLDVAVRRIHRTTHQEEPVYEGSAWFSPVLWNNQLYFAASGASSVSRVLHCVD